MRMRRKKNLEERLAVCEAAGKLKIIWCEERNFEESIKTKDLFDFEAMFGNSNPVHLEIGCGKGQFAVDLAKQNPNINILAVEKTSNVIVDAAEKVIEEETNKFNQSVIRLSIKQNSLYRHIRGCSKHSRSLLRIPLQRLP